MGPSALLTQLANQNPVMSEIALLEFGCQKKGVKPHSCKAVCQDAGEGKTHSIYLLTVKLRFAVLASPENKTFHFKFCSKSVVLTFSFFSSTTLSEKDHIINFHL